MADQEQIAHWFLKSCLILPSLFVQITKREAMVLRLTFVIDPRLYGC